MVSTVATAGKLNGPASVAIDAEGSLYICEAEGRCIRKLVRGATETVPLLGCAASAGKLVYPCDIAIDDAMFVYVADWGCDRVKRVDPRSGTVTIVAESAPLSKPVALKLSMEGALFVADWHSIHLIV
jgi:streptogramin lyase